MAWHGTTSFTRVLSYAKVITPVNRGPAAIIGLKSTLHTVVTIAHGCNYQDFIAVSISVVNIISERSLLACNQSMKINP